jgi:negative regulator of replication initiation
MKKTTIAVSPEVKAKIRPVRKGESHDDILRRLLSISEEEPKLIDEVCRRIKKTPRKEYVRLASEPRAVREPRETTTGDSRAHQEAQEPPKLGADWT